MMNALEELSKVSGLTWDEKVAILAVKLKELESVISPPSTPVSHRFEKSLYIRTMTIPADTIFIGRKHLRGHEVHLIRGRAIYITPKGKFEVPAPYSIFTAPGFAMVAYIIEEVEVETWHKDEGESRNIQALEARDFEDESICLNRGRAVQDRLHYQELTKGISEEYLKSLYAHTSDLFKEGEPSIEIGQSLRGGLGLFATQDFSPGDYIGIMSRGNRRTLLGRYTNHGLRSTCRLTRKDDEVHVFANESIHRGDELTVDYQVSVRMGAQICLAQ